jgi:hypothetical protein
MPPRPPLKPASTRKWNPALVIGLIAGVLVALLIIFFAIHQTHKRDANNAARKRDGRAS